MPHGYAYRVTYPRRKEQSYVTLDRDYVIEDVHQAVVELNWSIQVELVSFIGDGALSVTTSVHDLLPELPAAVTDRADVVEGKLYFLARKDKS